MTQSDAQRTLKLRLALGTIVTLCAGLSITSCQQFPFTSVTYPEPNSPPQGSVSSSNRSLRIGALLPASGDLGTTGQSMLKSLPVFVDTVNNCSGVNGTPLLLAVADEQTDPAGTAEAMTALAEKDQVGAVVGAFASRASAAALDVAIRKKVLMISPGSTSPDFTDRAKRFQGFWARTIPSDTEQAVALAKLAKDRGYLNVATVVENNKDGLSFEKAFVQAFEKLGGKVLGKAIPVRSDPEAVSLDADAISAFSADGQKPAAVVVALPPKTGALLLRSAYEYGLTEGVQILLTNTAQSDQLMKNVGKAADGKYILSGAIGTTPSIKGSSISAFTKFWRDKTNSVPDAFVSQTWDAASLIVLAAQAAGSNQGAQIKTKLQDVANEPGVAVTDVCQGLKLLREGTEINYNGVSGKVEIDENGDVPGDYDVWTIDEQNKIKTIEQGKFD